MAAWDQSLIVSNFLSSRIIAHIIPASTSRRILYSITISTMMMNTECGRLLQEFDAFQEKKVKGVEKRRPCGQKCHSNHDSVCTKIARQFVHCWKETIVQYITCGQRNLGMSIRKAM
jgi:hypothetical protein